MFSIEDNFQLAAFSGATSSIKRQSTAARAWRLGVTTRFESRDMVSGLTERDDVIISVAIPYYRLYYLNTSGAVRPYWGIGVRPALTYRDVELRADGDLTGSSRLTDIGLGLTGVVGVEWYFTESLSILAEYGSLLAYTRMHREDGSQTTGKRTSDTSVIEFDWEQVRFGLTAYW